MSLELSKGSRKKAKGLPINDKGERNKDPSDRWCRNVGSGRGVLPGSIAKPLGRLPNYLDIHVVLSVSDQYWVQNIAVRGNAATMVGIQKRKSTPELTTSQR